jgi:type IV fimbrial biogenesis protein FimT
MQGFTVIELLITLLLVSILLLIGFPAMHDLVMNNRATASVNNIVVGLQFARSEAIKNNVRVKFCKKDNWRDGQIVIDTSNDKILRVFPALAKGDKLTWKSSLGKDDYVEFSSLGFSEQKGTFTYYPNGENKYARKIVVNYTQVRVC